MTMTKEEIDRELASSMIRNKDKEFSDEDIAKLLEELGLTDNNKSVGLTE